MTPQVKICGLTRPEDVETAIRYGASFLGFIVEAKSLRRLSIGAATSLAAPAKGIIPRVAVTVNADDDLIARIMTEMVPDYIQCHGDEPPARLAAIRQKFDIKTIKAVPVSDSADMAAAKDYKDVCDFILYDAKPPKGTARGGHGLTFDWNILTQASLSKIWALAGGLTPDNARQATRRTHAPILDVSSGVEASPGLKDPDRIQAFMKIINPILL